jgi:hypothetical protein
VPDLQHIAAHRQREDQAHVLALLRVVARQLLPQPAGFYPDDAVLARVEAGFAAVEHIHAQCHFAKAAGVTAQDSVRQVPQKAQVARAAAEGRTGGQALQFRLHQGARKLAQAPAAGRWVPGRAVRADAMAMAMAMAMASVAVRKVDSIAQAARLSHTPGSRHGPRHLDVTWPFFLAGPASAARVAGPVLASGA